jgi:cytochrome P450
MSPPPGLGWTSTFSVIRAFQADALGLLERLHADHGDVVRFPVATDTVWLVTHPNHVQHVLKDNAKNYTKGRVYDDVRPVLGRGLITNEGESWLRQRRLAQPAFHGRHLEGFSQVAAEETERMLATWNAGETRDVSHDVMGLAFRIACRTLFGADTDVDIDEADRQFTAATRAAVLRTREVLKLPLGAPRPNNIRYRRAIAWLDTLVYRLIAERRARGVDRADLLGMLLSARDEDTGEGMDDRQLRDEVLTFLFAGHETTANTLAWALHLLATSPAELDALRADLATLPGPPRFADLPNVPRLRRIVEETLRLYPPVWWLERCNVAEDQLGAYTVPPGTRLALSAWVTHRLPEFWSDPLRFDPDRFLPARVEGRHKFAWYPFAGGPRICIGNTFAMVTTCQALGAVLHRFRVSPAPGHVVITEPLVTVRPKGGIPLRIHA